MRFEPAFLLALPALSAAYPGMMGASRAEMEEYLRQRHVEEAEPEKRQLLPGAITSLTSTITGLLGSVASAVDPSNKRPEAGYTFQAPGPSDSRGPCPGLNLLANYGYLPRNGHVNFGQVLAATARGFNMGADIATVLSVFAVITDGDIATKSWYLGSGPGGVGGLNRHSTVEADISPNREDYYNGCGDNHHLSSRLFRQNVGFAAAEATKQFTLDAMAKQYATSAQFSKTYNPYLYYLPFPQIVSLAAFAFYPQFFSNGTYGAGGVANYESISSIIGAQYDGRTGTFRYVPEKWPNNWYRRATPYTSVQALTEAFAVIYPRNVVVPGVPQLGTGNLTPRTVLCDIYMSIQSLTPLTLGRSVEDTARAISWALGVLAPFISGTALGCPAGVLSPNFLFPNASQTGGPQNLPPVRGRTGNNVYNRVYFTRAPTRPAC
ncbi:hypothetical protein K504DRAFT_107066 [Pleomassaria siparia CBS 279.74]|uniref:Heme haloperoxidase family profile domain-containing protein n=1 Tax=Pleomassaria siparia CBS 279.74 TaxID=1314801 RepID=A0A6G1JX84_9PLEO|nr:hypothetical protein K504DRAFT_107066 [Pleomassaria siparia CBS 279.74]